jgi:glycosyltransferase involved in cell wall biosynthesis
MEAGMSGSHRGRTPQPALRPVEAQAKSLRIAHVHTGITGSGGDRVSELEAAFLVARGHRVTMVGPVAPGFAERFATQGIAIAGEPMGARSVQSVRAQAGEFDLVHCHCMLSAPLAAELARQCGAALVIHNHSMGEAWWECTGAFSRLRVRKRMLRSEIDRAVAAADRVICVSEAVRDHMRAIGLPTERAAILPNPISDVFFRREAAAGEPCDVVVLARPSRAKSPITALRILAAARRLRPDLRMLWIGRLGRWEAVLRNAAKLLGLRGLAFRGAASPSEVCDILDGTRVLLSASNREGQPLSVLEALARQCSALLSDIPAHRALPRDEGVVLFPSGQIENAGRALVALLDRHVRRPRPFLENHRPEAHGRELLAIYEGALREALGKRESTFADGGRAIRRTR